MYIHGICLVNYTKVKKFRNVVFLKEPDTKISNRVFLSEMKKYEQLIIIISNSTVNLKKASYVNIIASSSVSIKIQQVMQSSGSQFTTLTKTLPSRQTFRRNLKKVPR